MSTQDYSPESYLSDIHPSWCKGCSYNSVLAALTHVFSKKKIDPLQLNLISGIGCSSRIPFFLRTFGMHTLHGRAIPVAIGSKLANPDIISVVVGGDGDLFSIGTGHFVHAARKNFNITVICLNNRIYAMTKNQASPTSPVGYKGTLTPYGKISDILNLMGFSISCGATFVARTHSCSIDHMTKILLSAMEHNGFSFVEVLSPCNTFNKATVKSESVQRLFDINQTSGHNPSDRIGALALASNAEDYIEDVNAKIPVGIYWKNDKPTFDSQVSELKNNHCRFDIHSILRDFSSGGLS